MNRLAILLVLSVLAVLLALVFLPRPASAQCSTNSALCYGLLGQEVTRRAQEDGPQLLRPVTPLDVPDPNTVYQRFGNTVYASDGSACTTVGTIIYCN